MQLKYYGFAEYMSGDNIIDLLIIVLQTVMVRLKYIVNEMDDPSSMKSRVDLC
jgi:hypothetical protein